MKFWKVGSRKLYAVRDRKGKKRARQEDSASDDENTNTKQVLQKMDRNIEKILEVTNKYHLPVGFYSVVMDAFMCKICQSITLPAIFARCCRTIIGCQTCVDHWYRGESGLDKKCPLCRGDRGYTCKISGLEDFLIISL